MDRTAPLLLPWLKRRRTLFTKVFVGSALERNFCPLVVLVGMYWLSQAEAMEMPTRTALAVLWTLSAISDSVFSLPVLNQTVPGTLGYVDNDTEPSQPSTSSAPSSMSTLPICNFSKITQPVFPLPLQAASLLSLNRHFPTLGVFAPDGCPLPGQVTINKPFLTIGQGSSFEDFYYAIGFQWKWKANETGNSAVVGFQVKVLCDYEQDNILVSKEVTWLNLAYDQTACKRRAWSGSYCYESQVVRRAILSYQSQTCHVLVQPLPAANFSVMRTSPAQIKQAKKDFQLPSCRDLGCPKTIITINYQGIQKALCRCVPNPPGSLTAIVQLNSTSVQVNWTAARDPYVSIASYLIVMAAKNPMDTKMMEVHGPDTESAVLPGLQPGKSYLARVVSIPSQSLFVFSKSEMAQHASKSGVTAKELFTMKPPTDLPTVSSSSAPASSYMTSVSQGPAWTTSPNATMQPVSTFWTTLPVRQKTDTRWKTEVLVLIGVGASVGVLIVAVSIRYISSRNPNRKNSNSNSSCPLERTSKPIQATGHEDREGINTPDQAAGCYRAHHPYQLPHMSNPAYLLDGQPAIDCTVIGPHQYVHPQPMLAPFAAIAKPYISYSRFEQEIADKALVLAEMTYSATGGAIDFIIDQKYLNDFADNHFAWIERHMGQQSRDEQQYIVVILSDKYPLVLPEEARKILREREDDFKKAELEIQIFQADTYHGREDFLVPVYFGPRPLPFDRPTIFRGKTIYYLTPPYDPSINKEYQNFLSRFYS